MSGQQRGAVECRVDDREMLDIVADEERVLSRVHRTLEARTVEKSRTNSIDYEAELLNLRDQIRDARLEDIPPLIEEMERLQQVAARRAKVTEGTVDPSSPYFGRLVLEEDDRRREVLIGRSTWLDRKTGVRIVDWRDAPVSRVYYRYEEGDDYEEIFGGKPVEGEVLVRRSLAIYGANLRRIGCPQGTFVLSREHGWRRADASVKLSGGQGAAMRPEAHQRPTKLGIGNDELRTEDKSLGEITALIDPRQFELITKPDSGLVVIQGGAGSGKTTIGLHRLAYLAFQDPNRFRAKNVLVVVFNDALVRYIARVLPSLGVEGVEVVTYQNWASKARRARYDFLPNRYAEETPTVVTRMKKHPVMLRLMEAYAKQAVEEIEQALSAALKTMEDGDRVLRFFRNSTRGAPGQRLSKLLRWANNRLGSKYPPAHLGQGIRHALDRVARRARETKLDVLTAWADLLTDRQLLLNAFEGLDTKVLTKRELEWAHAWCTRRCPQIVACRDEASERSEGEARSSGESARGIDGEDEREEVLFDEEDDALLLRLTQLLTGPLRAKRESLRYEHILLDEAQDLSPVELAVVLETTGPSGSITLAGDVAQRLHMDNGFSDWRTVLSDLRFDRVDVEPLKLSYRSTHEILDFATDVLGPLRNEVSGKATRHGAPVELFRFGDAGECVGFLAEALRELVRAEPLSSVAVIARYPEQADLYFRGLHRGEVPNLRRIADQDFPFRPGVDVTDIRQVKGLEFDYVILVECDAATYPEDVETRHLLHIGATRAAHQLWLTITGRPSPLIPASLRERDF
ncbi:MAG: 3'-5' exonuclease [Myxococcota bacterium]